MVDCASNKIFKKNYNSNVMFPCSFPPWSRC